MVGRQASIQRGVSFSALSCRKGRAVVQLGAPIGQFASLAADGNNERPTGSGAWRGTANSNAQCVHICNLYLILFSFGAYPTVETLDMGVRN